MGYCTRFELEVCNPRTAESVSVSFPELTERTICELRNKNESARFALDEDGRAEESIKWYDHETDLREFSKSHPDFLFVLYGEGEESGDVWKKYFLNGKMQFEKAMIKFAPFNPAKLK